MATISAFSPLNLPRKMNSYKSHPSTLPPPSISKLSYSFHGFPKFLTLKIRKNSYSHSLPRINSVEEEIQIPEQQVKEEQEEPQQQDEQQTVSVPVSPSDTLTMLFQAEGTMSESAIPKVTNVLKETEGVTDLKVQVLEGIASVELTKQTTVQATGVASSLVELIQGSGFKLQTLNLSFQDEEDIILV